MKDSTKEPEGSLAQMILILFIFGLILTPIFLFLTGCAHYIEPQKLCYELMKKQNVETQHVIQEMDEFSDYEYGWELGFSAGYFAGCTDYVTHGNRHGAK